MKKALSIIVIAMILCIGSTAFAAPFLVCDPQAGVEYYVVTGLPAAIDASRIPPDASGTFGFKLDLGPLAVGSYTVKAKACAGVWGCSADSSPFVFTKPALSTAPVNVRLAP